MVPCADVVDEVGGGGGEAVGVMVDVAENRSVQAMATRTLEIYGRIDILVNNASVLPVFAPFDEIRDTEWDRVMAVNVRGMWGMLQSGLTRDASAGRGQNRQYVFRHHLAWRAHAPALRRVWERGPLRFDDGSGRAS